MHEYAISTSFVGGIEVWLGKKEDPDIDETRVVQITDMSDDLIELCIRCPKQDIFLSFNKHDLLKAIKNYNDSN